MKRSKALVLLLFTLLALTVACGCDVVTGAAFYEPPAPAAVATAAPLPELPPARWSEELAAADLVVLGTVTALQDTIMPDDKIAFTTADLSVEQVLKGDPGIEKVTFRAPIDFPGTGFLPDQAREWPYMVSERLLISLHREPGGTYTKGQIYWGESPKVEIPPASYYAGNYEYTVYGEADWVGLIIRVMQEYRIPVAMENPPVFNPERKPLD